MRRQELLALAACEPPRTPVDEGRLNEFAAAYNDYVMRLRNGELSLKGWADVIKAWGRLR
jgi:hypothetical protein